MSQVRLLARYHWRSPSLSTSVNILQWYNLLLTEAVLCGTLYTQSTYVPAGYADKANNAVLGFLLARQ
jgi:hypothetical protein